jgi:hypothetical protein
MPKPQSWRTKQSVKEVVAALKERYKAERVAKREQRLLLAFNAADREQRHNDTIPHRKPTVTKANSFNATLAKIPGGVRDESTKGAYAAFLKQSHPDTPTGCITVNPGTLKGQATLRRLANSAKNANTTHGNYNSTSTT